MVQNFHNARTSSIFAVLMGSSAERVFVEKKPSADSERARCTGAWLSATGKFVRGLVEVVIFISLVPERRHAEGFFLPPRNGHSSRFDPQPWQRVKKNRLGEWIGTLTAMPTRRRCRRYRPA